MSFLHDPAAVLDYRWDWSAWLAAGETITARTVTVTAGDVTVNSSSFDGSSVTAWISGGTANSQARIGCHITTSAARQDDRTVTLIIRNR